VCWARHAIMARPCRHCRLDRPSNSPTVNCPRGSWDTSRHTLWAVQTPQIGRRVDLLKHSMNARPAR